MLVKSYIWGMSITAVLAILAFGLVLWYFDPNTSGVAGVILFFLTLMPALVSGAVLAFYGWHRRHEIEPMPALVVAGRQGTILGLLAIGVLILQVTNVLAWWNAGALLAVGVFIEFYSRVKVEK